MTIDAAVWLEASKDKCLHKLLKRYAILEPKRDGNREAVHQGAEGSSFAVHVDEDLSERAILVLAGADIHLVTANPGLLGVALSAARHLASFADVAIHQALCHLLD